MDRGPEHVVVVVNPVKADPDRVGPVLEEECRQVGVASFDLVTTSVGDPGSGQARAAVRDGADLVCALGGDGTVRAVAQELAGSSAALGLLAGGTGNLLVRNLGTPDDLGAAARVALSGRSRAVDVGWLALQPRPDQRRGALDRRSDNVHCFTVMAGLGFDAQVMDSAPEGVKEKAGWAAYVAAGSKHLAGRGFRLDLEVDGDTTSHPAARTALVGNCGELTGGMVLLPEARVDDGVLDVAVLTPENIGSWLSTALRVLTRRRDHGPSVAWARGRDVLLRVDPPQLCQADGDVLAETSEVRLQVQRSALQVRVPAPAEGTAG